MSRIRRALLAGAIGATALACGSDAGSETDGAESVDTVATTGDAVATTVDSSRYPDVIEGTAVRAGDGWTFSATISSPYDSPERYADAWRVLAPDGTVLGVRELTHDHAAEQPFTRSLPGVVVPDSVELVTIEGRDSEYGWGGATVDVELTNP